MTEQPADPSRDARLEAAAYSPVARMVTATTFATSRILLPALVVAAWGFDVPATPATVAVWGSAYLVVALIAATMTRAARVTVEVDGPCLAFERRGLRVEVAWHAVARVVPWRVPLPAVGVDLALASGGRLGWGLAAADATPLLAALAARGVAGAAEAGARAPFVAAHARAAVGRWRWWHHAMRFPLFALVPTALLFNVHQHIAYGGLLGQYYTYGLGPWLQTLAIYWATVTFYQLCWAGCWRGAGEAACLLTAAVAPSRATRVRRIAERTIDVLYYGGVLALLALRFAA